MQLQDSGDSTKMSKEPKEPVVASDVIAVLKEHGPLKRGAHAWLCEVRNATGYSHSHPRYADALVVSLWPSRGIWFAGIEVKVQRTDWLKELRDPKKAESIQKYCHYWWIATPPDIVKPGELPKTWGHIVVNGKTPKVMRQAPELKPSVLDPAFVASVLRNASANQVAVSNEARLRGQRETEEKLAKEREQFAGFDDQLCKLTDEKTHIQNRADNVNSELEKVRRQIREFEEAAGIPAGTIAARGYRADHDTREAAELYKLAKLLKVIDSQRWHAELKKIVDGFESLNVMVEQVKTGS